ncbi:50S ribosomal protein L11 methyltransferase [Granulicatella sp. zg-ZJ]|uniref:50S ribosomal protein L11 methyltransferase n=1 Tax=Granulicatella sp. zg-ZJ TaxID=2678504 RepID=UPI0013D579BB|nr:50S ribosomal protein L11 methyltransferase [Granulicatella sp. zg-ZJ]MBS4750364.1 50S ribosomal protein L11 methyltransferase [Carnobacteriaceae bacterium zg-ZUI78]NEW63242.1 50S ribosomal protein L11 methyltransferase [Granulicatella sp. zg-ZJ]
MKWYELKIATTSPATEMVSSILIEAGSNGVSIEDPSDLLYLEDDGFGQIKPEVEDIYDTQEVFVSGYFPDTKNIIEIQSLIQEKLNEATQYDLPLGRNEILLSSVSEEDWANAWKKHYFPVRITRYLTVVPSWIDYQPSEHEQIIEMDPGMAFGTGTHPTTQLSLEALERVIRGGEIVLDVGTGSGVLSIASKKLGAKHVTAYDLDEKATSVARENILLNGYADIIVKENDLLTGVRTQVDIIVANILAEILEKLVDDAWDNLKYGGHFILSGIILSKKEQLMIQLQQKGFDIIQENCMKDWVSLICVKPLEDDACNDTF